MRSESQLTAEDRAFLRSLPMFATVEAAVFDSIAGTAQPVLIPARTVLFNEGQDGTDIYAVVSGWVKLYRMSPSGVEAVIALYNRGKSFAEAAALLRRPYPASAEAVTDCRLIRINAGQLSNQIESNPKLAFGMMAAMSRQLHLLVNDIARLKAMDGIARVVEFLSDIASTQQGLTFPLPFEKQLLARHLAMQPESLSRTLRRLKTFGVVVDGRSVTLTTPDALARASAACAP